MTSHTPAETAQLRQLLRPMLCWDSPERETSVGRTLGEGLGLPDVDAMIAHARPPEEIDSMLRDAANRIRSTLRAEWLVQPIGERLFGVPEAIDDEDALIGAWICGGRTLQVVVTRKRLHLMTRLSEASPATSRAEAAQRAFATAYELLQFPSPPEQAAWDVRPLGGLTVGRRYVDSPRTWQETLFWITDGLGVKYSTLKCTDRARRPSVGSALRSIIPWFPRPELDDGPQEEDEAVDDEYGIEDWVEEDV